MTFVRTRLLIERMAAGDTATIVLCGAEPIENVPASVTELGHLVTAMRPLAEDPARARIAREREIRDGDMVLRIAKT